MNSHPYSPNLNQLCPELFSSPNQVDSRGTSSPYSHTNWRSPTWTPRHHFSDYNGPNNAIKNNFKVPHSNVSTPRNNSYSYQKQNSSFISTPRSSGNSSFSSDGSGSASLLFSSPDRRFSSPYGRRGVSRFRCRRSYDSNRFHEKPNIPVEMYFKPSMLQNPWKKLEKPFHGKKQKNDEISSG